MFVLILFEFLPLFFNIILTTVVNLINVQRGIKAWQDNKEICRPNKEIYVCEYVNKTVKLKSE